MFCCIDIFDSLHDMGHVAPFDLFEWLALNLLLAFSFTRGRVNASLYRKFVTT